MISHESMINYLMNESLRQCANNPSNQQQWSNVLAQLEMQSSQPPPPLLLNMMQPPMLQPKTEIMDDDDDIMGDFGDFGRIECKLEDFSPSKNSLASTSTGSLSPNSSEDDFHFGNIQSKQRCAVCGDAATGFHYDTASCNGCKTFFRRTVVTGRNFVCKKGGRCSFDKNGRCACRACRFSKCVAAGMNPQAIQYTPSANLTLSIARKCFMKAKRNATKQIGFVEKPIPGVQDEILRRIGHVLHLEEKYTRLRGSTFYPYNEDLTLHQLLNFNTSFGEAERYPLVEKWPSRKQLMEKFGNPQRDHILRKEQVKLGIKFWYYLDLYLSVDYLKTFDVFNELSDADKLTLCQAVAIPSYHIANAFFSYQQRSDILVYPDGGTMFYYKSNDELMDIEKVLRSSVIDQVTRMKMDQIQYSLLRAIVALHDGCQKLSPEARAKISQERAKYTTALLRYLQNKHGLDVGNRRFGESLAILNELFYRSQHNYNYYVYRKYVEHTITPANLMADLLEENCDKSDFPKADLESSCRIEVID